MEKCLQSYLIVLFSVITCLPPSVQLLGYKIQFLHYRCFQHWIIWRDFSICILKPMYFSFKVFFWHFKPMFFFFFFFLSKLSHNNDNIGVIHIPINVAQKKFIKLNLLSANCICDIDKCWICQLDCFHYLRFWFLTSFVSPCSSLDVLLWTDASFHWPDPCRLLAFIHVSWKGAAGFHSQWRPRVA